MPLPRHVGNQTLRSLCIESRYLIAASEPCLNQEIGVIGDLRLRVPGDLPVVRPGRPGLFLLLDLEQHLPNQVHVSLHGLAPLLLPYEAETSLRRRVLQKTAEKAPI